MKTAYIIAAKRETYSVTAEGFIGRPALKMEPSGQWKVRGASRRNNFGHRTAFVPFPACMAIKDWTNKNGSARWHLCDTDHGTDREWGETVYSIREAA